MKNVLRTLAARFWIFLCFFAATTAFAGDVQVSPILDTRTAKHTITGATAKALVEVITRDLRVPWIIDSDGYVALYGTRRLLFLHVLEGYYERGTFKVKSPYTRRVAHAYVEAYPQLSNAAEDRLLSALKRGEFKVRSHVDSPLFLLQNFYCEEDVHTGESECDAVDKLFSWIE